MDRKRWNVRRDDVQGKEVINLVRRQCYWAKSSGQCWVREGGRVMTIELGSSDDGQIVSGSVPRRGAVVVVDGTDGITDSRGGKKGGRA